MTWIGRTGRGLCRALRLAPGLAVLLLAAPAALAASPEAAVPVLARLASMAGAPVGAGPASPALGLARMPASPLPGAKVRTPGRIEALVMQSVLREGDRIVLAADAQQAAPALAAGEMAGWLGAGTGDVALPEPVRRIRLPYALSPLAILRTDTDIHDWQALRGRTVCLSADGRYGGELAGRYGAVEQIYPSITDALLGVRTGACDALVHDQAFLEALLKFPEWKKFSARLEPYRRVGLVRLQGQGGSEATRRLAQASTPARLAALTARQAKDIAFEVYLDQTVPDCH